MQDTEKRKFKLKGASVLLSLFQETLLLPLILLSLSSAKPTARPRCYPNGYQRLNRWAERHGHRHCRARRHRLKPAHDQCTKSQPNPSKFVCLFSLIFCQFPVNMISSQSMFVAVRACLIKARCVWVMRQKCGVCWWWWLHASVSQGQICLDSYMRCDTEIEVVDQTRRLPQSQCTGVRSVSHSADPVLPGAWKDSH